MYYGRTNIVIERVLSKGIPRTAFEVSAQTGVSVGTVSKRLSAMRGRGEVHIAEWKREQPNAKPYLRAAYVLGEGANKPKPKPLTDAEKKRRQRRKGEVKSVWVSGTFSPLSASCL